MKRSTNIVGIIWRYGTVFEASSGIVRRRAAGHSAAAHKSRVSTEELRNRALLNHSFGYLHAMQWLLVHRLLVRVDAARVPPRILLLNSRHEDFTRMDCVVGG